MGAVLQQIKIVNFRLKNPYIWMLTLVKNINIGLNHPLFRIIIIKSCFAGGGGERGGGRGEVDRDLHQLAKPAYRSQCAHTEHSEGPMDTVLSSRLLLEW